MYQGNLSPATGAMDTSQHPLGKGDDIQKTEGATYAVVTYGRFQPPTIGHGVLLRDLYERANMKRNRRVSSISPASPRERGDAYVFVSASCNEGEKYQSSKLFQEIVGSQRFESCKLNENPLNTYQRVFYLKTLFAKDVPGMKVINTVEKGIRGPPDAIEELVKEGYGKIIFKCGSDRVQDFRFLEKKHPGVVRVERAGEVRDEEGVIDKDTKPYQMSGTKMRLAAVEGKILSFKKGLMNGEEGFMGYMTDDLAVQLMNDIRAGLQTKLKPLRMEEMVMMGGKGQRRAFQRFVKRVVG